jgi:hypothetical protein
MKQATLHYDPRTRTGALVSDQGHGIECVELFTVPGSAPFFNVNGVELVELSSTPGVNNMNAYIYRAALYCEECAMQIRHTLRYQPREVVIDREDSESWPQGPYSDGGGEADSPQHCDSCGVFLENPLTDEGREYVREKVREATGRADVLNTWREFYGIEA